MSEHDEQVKLFAWAEWAKNRRPCLEFMYAVPNAAKRSHKLANYMKAEGLKSGVPDVCLPFPSKGYHGLYIEMKFGKNKESDNQKKWLQYLHSVRYYIATCYSSDDAIETIEWYLENES